MRLNKFIDRSTFRCLSDKEPSTREGERFIHRIYAEKSRPQDKGSRDSLYRGKCMVEVVQDLPLRRPLKRLDEDGVRDHFSFHKPTSLLLR